MPNITRLKNDLGMGGLKNADVPWLPETENVLYNTIFIFYQLDFVDLVR